jgi:diamine N-acetyltransferase
MLLSIRAAVASDYEGLCVLFHEGDTLHNENLPRIFRKHKEPVRERDSVLSLIAAEDVGFFVAQSENRLTGMICVLIKESPDKPFFTRRRYALVDEIVVLEKYRRSGIGQALIEKAQEWALAKGAESIELNVWEFNQDAIDFYKKLGYETASRKMNKQLR